MPSHDVEYLEREYGMHAVLSKTNSYGLPLVGAKDVLSVANGCCNVSFSAYAYGNLW